MDISEEQIQQFETEGWTRIAAALPEAVIAPADRCVRRRYADGPQHDGIVGLPDDPGLDPLLTEARLEDIAERMLGGPVVLNSSAILFKRPQPQGSFALEREHVDIMYSLDEWRARPRRVMCMLMVLLADLPAGRGNTWIRPGSHLQLAEWLQRHGREPIKAQPTNIGDLPDLPWREAVPVIGRAGDVIAFNTNLIHSGTPNRDSEARRIMFINFCPRGMMRECSGNHDRRELRSQWRDTLRARVPPERQHLLEGSELAIA